MPSPVEVDAAGDGERLLAVAAAGFATQWVWRFDLPFVIDVAMFPLHLLEWFLRFSITR